MYHCDSSSQLATPSPLLFSIRSSLPGSLAMPYDSAVFAAMEPTRPPGRCSMRGNCGKKSIFSPDLPCAVDQSPATPPDDKLKAQLASVCGSEFAQAHSNATCCSAEQVSTLASNLAQAEPLISSCPACRNNFRDFFCTFTCSSNQSQFLDISRSQKTSTPGPDGDDAVKSVEYYVSEEFRQGFYDSCKNVKFGASNGFAMDLLGGGATDADGFLKYMGDEKPLLGSPFQINFPHLDKAKPNITHGPPEPFNARPRSCSDPDLSARCACVDCPDVCTALPHLDPPTRQDICTIGAVSCYSFALLILYSVALLASTIGYGATKGIRSRRNRKRRRMGIRHRFSGISVASESSGHEQVRLNSEDTGASSTPASYRDDSSAEADAGLVGATGLGRFDGTEEESNSSTGGNTLPRDGSGPLDALGTVQPRSYALSNYLSHFFYRLGLLVTRAPLLTFALGAVLVALCNLGWSSFHVETDPVRLWVAPQSESKLRKEYFDEHFGPFYRTQQLFVMDKAGKDLIRSDDLHTIPRDAALAELPPALSFDRLQWLQDVETEVRNLRTKVNGVTLQDVCFAPTGPGLCVVQSVMGYFQDNLANAGIDESNWKNALNRCAKAPAECLPAFSAPLKPNVILGGITSRPSEARSAVTTYVINNSQNTTELALAQEWELALEQLLFGIAGINDEPEHPLGLRRRELGLELVITTESSLQQELGSSSNTDGPTIVASYLLMFLYAAMTLGGSTAGSVINDRVTSGRAASARANQDAPNGVSLRSGLAGRFFGFLRFQQSGPNKGANRRRLLRRLFVDSKFTLGLFGIIIVLASVSSAIGLLSFAGVSTTLIIAEVLPFLVLAVGVDNIFLLANEMDRQSTLASTSNPYSSASLSRSGAVASQQQQQRQQQQQQQLDVDSDDEEGLVYGGGGDTAEASHFHLSSSERAARALSRMGPSILLSGTTQITAFLLGAIVPMPAVRNFALYAAFSMLMVVILQCTCFVAAMKLDADRTESNRVDCFPCFKIGGAISLRSGAFSLPHASEGVLGRFIRRNFASTLVKPFVKKLVLALFSGLFVLSLIGARKVEMGLDQRLALPVTSYLRDYFNSLDTFLDVGPPVYFVSRKVDPTRRPGQQSLCGRFTTCNEFSLANVLEGERKRPDVSFLAEPANSWIDDFFTYLNPVLSSCCRVKKADPTQFCSPRDPGFRCKSCFEDRQPPWNITLDGMPEDEEFMRYLDHWLQAPTNEDCPLGGQASYSSALSVVNDGVIASHFRTYHTPLRSQADFIDALKASERISQDLTTRNAEANLEVFPYSVFYVFFDQYLHLISLTATVMGSAIAAIFGVTTVLLGSWRTGLVVAVCVISALTGVVGFMGITGIGFNALTLVNLSVCAAICVEFQAHVAKSFMKSPSHLPRAHPMAQKERDERAWTALTDVGGSVLSGITGTKLVGISVLAFTRSELLRLYYAKMWAALIFLGALHGLVLLPVLLSYFGGSGYSSDEDESEVRRRLLRAQDSAEYRPFAAEEDEEDDDEDDDEEDQEAASFDSRTGRY